MKENYQFRQATNYLEIKMELNSGENVKLLKQSYLKILSMCFLNKAIEVVTIQPQKNSLGHEFSSSTRSEIENTEILISDIFADGPSLTLLSESEEFARGLLIILFNEDDLYSSVKNVLMFQKQQLDCITPNDGVLVFCNNDGNIFYIFNDSISIETLLS